MDKNSSAIYTTKLMTKDKKCFKYEQRTETKPVNTWYFSAGIYTTNSVYQAEVIKVRTKSVYIANALPK